MADGVDAAEPVADFETLIADISSSFIHLPPGDVDREIGKVLRRVCTQFVIDLAVLWQWSTASPRVIVPTHFHYAQAGRQPPEPMDERQFPWYVQQMLDGRSIAISSLDDLPAEAAVDREYGRLFGIRSNLCLPLALGGEPPVGALGLSTLTEERDWPDPVVRRLQLVAQLITSALGRKRADEALHESEERLRLAIDAAEAGLWTLDVGSGVFFATPRARALFGYAPDEAITLQCFEASVHPDDWPRVRDAMTQCLRTGAPIDVEYRITVAGQTGVRWIASRGGRPVAPGAQARRLMGISVDIGERRRLEDELRTNEARLQAGADLAGLAYYAVDFRAGVVRLDGRCRDLLGLAPEQTGDLAPLQLWMDRIHPEDRPRVLDLREQLHSGKLERIGLEYRYLHPGRGTLWFDHLAAVAERGADRRTVLSYGVLRDIGRQKRAEMELREMSQRLLLAQERERALIARELHDDLTQRLAVLAIDVGRAETAAADPGLAETLRSLREQLVRISEDVHAIAYQLHPSILEELGLAEALRAEVERRRRQSRLDVSLALEPLPEGIGKDTELCLFRVAQEALSNVIRHARASNASVRLRLQDGGLLLAVSDDGVGFDPHRREGARSLGLASMQERLRIVQGTLDIDSAPGSGTTVVAWAPAGAAP